MLQWAVKQEWAGIYFSLSPTQATQPCPASCISETFFAETVFMAAVRFLEGLTQWCVGWKVEEPRTTGQN